MRAPAFGRSAVEIDSDAAATYRANFGDHVWATPIEDVPDEAFPAGGRGHRRTAVPGILPLGAHVWGPHQSPPERAVAGVRARDPRRGAPGVRHRNVPQFLKSREFDAFQRVTEDLGYAVVSGVLNALDFGIAQKRRRAILIGSAAGPPSLPDGAPGSPRTVADALGRLPEPIGIGEGLAPGRPVSDLDLHFGRNPRPKSIKRYKLVPPGGNRFDPDAEGTRDHPPLLAGEAHREYGCVRPAAVGISRPLTIRTEFFKPEKGRYLHPAEHRPITHLEAALLQDFDRSYQWTGSKISVARQIGNAVPPALRTPSPTPSSGSSTAMSRSGPAKGRWSCRIDGSSPR